MVPPARRQLLIGLVATLVAIAALGSILERERGSVPSSRADGRAAFRVDEQQQSKPDGDPVPTFQAASGQSEIVTVDVAGGVRRPGVYELPAGARVLDAIARAGGTTPGAQLVSINRAAPLVDGQQVVVPEPGAVGTAASPGATSPAAPAVPVSINSADVDALDQLPGIGPATAAQIVADRSSNGPFQSVDDLDRVPGVGPATVEALRDLVTM